MNRDLKVLFLAAEATPFSKVGGLADIAGALPAALRRLGVDVRLMIPRYGDMRGAGPKCRRIASLDVPVGSGEHALLLAADSGDVPAYLIWNDQYFANRERVYGFNDDPQRFAFFSRGVITALKTLDWKPDVIHSNDWHTAPVPAWLDVYGRRDDDVEDIATLFTIHNLAYQGICGRLLLRFAKMDDLPHLAVEIPGQVNWMAQGIAHADLISTVSAAYAHEVLTEEAGMNLQSLLNARHDRLFGILSGIDTELWNPATDEVLTQTFDADSSKMRAVNKAALQREVHLAANAGTPLLGMVTRLDGMKGLDLVIPMLEALFVAQDAQFVLLGTGDALYEEQFRELQAQFPNNVRAFLRFDERMARRIYGSADVFLAPSRAEPSGIGLMTAMCYGAVPVVRETGGLADVVVDASAQSSRGTGFVFVDYTVEALSEAVQRALDSYGNVQQWSQIQRRAMTRDFSWDASARAYIDLYERALALHQARQD